MRPLQQSRAGGMHEASFLHHRGSGNRNLSMWESAIEERKQKDGWDNGTCPECMYLHAAEIAAERAAEVHEYEEER